MAGQITQDSLLLGGVRGPVGVAVGDVGDLRQRLLVDDLRAEAAAKAIGTGK